MDRTARRSPKLCKHFPCTTTNSPRLHFPKRDRLLLVMPQSTSFKAPLPHSSLACSKFLTHLGSDLPSSEATVFLVPVSKQAVSKQGIWKSLVSHVLNLKSLIKLICDIVHWDEKVFAHPDFRACFFDDFGQNLVEILKLGEKLVSHFKALICGYLL